MSFCPGWDVETIGEALTVCTQKFVKHSIPMFATSKFVKHSIPLFATSKFVKHSIPMFATSNLVQYTDVCY